MSAPTCNPCQTIVCLVEDDFLFYSISAQPTPLSPVPPTCVQCQTIVCEIPADYRFYSTEGLPPLPLPPAPITPPLRFTNDEVYYDVAACGLGTTLTVTPASLLPGWILLDNSNHQLIGIAGVIRGFTKAAATASAQGRLNTWVLAALADGTLTCAAMPLVLFYDDFEDYTNGEAVNGLGLGDWTNLPSPFVDT
jgi:hypothetical protein